jgi:hypothetical protein
MVPQKSPELTGKSWHPTASRQAAEPEAAAPFLNPLSFLILHTFADNVGSVTEPGSSH